VFFNLNPKVDLSGWAPLEASMHEGRKRGLLSELFFNFYELPDGLTLDLHHSAEFFSPARAREIVADLRDVIMELAGGPARTAPPALPALSTPATSATPAAPPPRLDARLLSWNATDAPLDGNARIEQWIAAQAAATPEATAVIAGGTRLSYRELEARANRYAHVLRQRNVGAGDRVGLSLARGPQLLPALLGVLKAGAAYVPLDPGFPRERLAYMAEDARLSLVITETTHADLSGLPRERQLRVDEDAALIDAASDAALPPAAGGGAATAYVIYTSGSTGRPKGVVLPQRAVCNFLASMRREPGLEPADRLLAVTTLSFDIAVLELLLPLTCGASVVLAVREDAMDGEALAALIAEHRITVMQATPTTWHLLLDAGWRAPAGFRALCGGEALPPALATALRAQSIELWNLYGPTETTVWSTLVRIDDATQRITIGRPIANTQVWVLDDALAPCAVGDEGEICIGGMGLADGYFERPDLTAERFVTLPSGPRPGERVYRDGELEHLGRLDFQVKLRGYRIELGEIEAKLAQAPGVARSVVVARELTPGDMALVGYVVARADARIESESLRQGLKSTLPDYMVPAQIVVLDAMPLLPNGKIDRKSLPQPLVEARAPTRAVESPRTPTERLVADAMAQVLGVAAVGPRDHFFELGGHSLLAAKLAAMLGRQIGQQIRLRTLFEAPVVAALAAAIDAMRGEAQAPSRQPIVHRAEQREAPLTLMQERMRFVEEMHPGRVVYNAPSAHRFKGAMDVAAFDRAFALMVQRQPGLRTAIVRDAAGRFVQRVEPEVAATMLPVVDLSRLAPVEREAQLAAMLRSLADETFELDRAPLFKVRLFKLADDEHALFFMAHHIIWDGWSFDILYAEMSALYESLRHGREPDLAPLPVTYGDYAEWHAAWLQGTELREQVAQWKKQFQQGAELLPAPTDFPRELASGGRGETCWIGLDEIRLEPVRALAKRAGTTTSIVMLAVYSAMMSQWLREPSPSIGMPVRGRGTPELDGIMGFFNNMLPIRLPLEPASTCLQWIASVHRMVAAGYANQDAPFELLAAEVEAGRNGAPTTLYQAMFSYQDARARETRWGNLEHDRIQLLHRGASEDLNLWMVETPAGVEAGLQYNADLFLPGTAEALCRRFLALLDATLAMPEQPVRTLLAAGEADRRRLADWSRPARPAPGVDLLDAIADFARREPEHAALRVGGKLVTRAALQARIAKVDALLESAGAPVDGEALLQLGDPVSEAAAALVLWRRGMTVVAAPVGIAVDTAGAALVVSDHAADPATATAQCWVQAGAEPAWPDGARAARGVAVGRRTLGEMVAALAGTTRLLPGDRALCLDGDEPALRLFVLAFALSSGASVDICDGGIAADAQRLATTLVEEKVAFLHASGAVWRDVLAALRGRPLELVAMLDVAELDADLATRLLGDGCSVLSVFRPPRLGMPLAAALVRDARDCRLFGRPLLEDAVAPVDDHGEIVPATVAGELAITFAGVTERSGMLARWRSDGQLQYLGGSGAAAPLQARPAPRRAATDDATELSPTQQALVQVWQEVLGVDDVGLQDNFFELGGTSLGAMQVAQRLEQRLEGRRVSPRRYVFETLEQLAAALDAEEAAAAVTTETPAAPASRAPTAAPGLFQRLKRLAVRA
jgi:amino acid adenylation domain-containing protein